MVHLTLCQSERVQQAKRVKVTERAPPRTTHRIVSPRSPSAHAAPRPAYRRMGITTEVMRTSPVVMKNSGAVGSL